MNSKKCAAVSGISVLYFVLCIVFGVLKYSTNDDAIMNMIAAGAYGSPSQYLIYNNIVIGYALKIMYTVIPFVNWYLWMYLVFNLLSVIVVCLVLTDRISIRYTVLVTVLVNLLLSYDFYSEIQFTQSSTFYAIAGASLILLLMFKEKKSIPLMVLGTVLVAMGVGARALGVGIMLPFLFFAILFYKGEFRPKVKKVLIYFAAPVITSVFLLAVNFYTYYMNPEWKNFMVWNNIMVEKCDHGNYNFAWNSDEYINAGFTENDFKLLDMWLWNDTDYFSLDKLQEMREIGKETRVDRLRLDAEVFSGTVNNIANSWKYGASPVIFLVITLISLCLFKVRYKLLVLLQALFVFAEYYVLTCSKRIMWRVESGIWLSALFFTLITLIYSGCFDDILAKVTADKAKKFFGVFAVVSSTVITLIFGAQKVGVFVKDKGCRIVAETDFMYYKLDALSKLDGFYITDVDTFYGPLCGARNIFDIDAKYRDFYGNICPFGGWVMPSPIGLYHANSNGISNPATALIERDDVYYVGGGERTGYVYVFLNEKYGPGINMEMVDEVEGAPIWKFYK